MKNTFLIISLLFFFGCNDKKETSKENSKPIKEEVVKEKRILSVALKFNTNITDKFQFIFSQIELDSNKEGVFMINENINNSEEFYTKKYEMYADLIPLIVQYKLGAKPKKMVVDNIVVNYGKEEIIVNGEDLDKYFFLNNYIDFDPTTKTITTKSVNGSHHPHITLKRGFINKLFELE